jgi:aryl-alcohol dehydrogenase-like predicted oxidoreductase
LWRAFDIGITHFDLANNYGPPPGSAEENFGQILKQDFAAYRDEMIISTKAGYGMWPGLTENGALESTSWPVWIRVSSAWRSIISTSSTPIGSIPTLLWRRR